MFVLALLVGVSDSALLLGKFEEAVFCSSEVFCSGAEAVWLSALLFADAVLELLLFEFVLPALLF